MVKKISITVAAVLLLAISCGSKKTDTPSGTEVLASVQARGGLCVYGPCDSTLTIRANGTTEYKHPNNAGSEVVSTGTVAATQLTQLKTAIAAVNVAAIKSKPFTGTCPVAYDGQERIYGAYISGTLESFPSCTYQLDGSLPLFVQLDALLNAAATPPATDTKAPSVR